jgi:outer membrane protein assembly factor BamB
MGALSAGKPRRRFSGERITPSRGHIMVRPHLPPRPARASGFAFGLVVLGFVLASPLAAAPGDVIWVFQGVEDINAATQVPDLNQDGVPEIAVETYDAGVGTGVHHLYLLSGGSSGTAQVLWSIRPPGGPSSSGSDGDDCLSTAPDLNGDGFPDLVLGTAWGGRTAYGIDAVDGDVLWSFDTYVNNPPFPATSGWVYTIHPIADLDGDLVADAIFGCGSDNNGGYAVNGRTGAVIYRLNALDVLYSSGVLGSIDADPRPEAVFGGGDGDFNLYCLRGASQGTASLAWSVNNAGTNWHLTAIPDVNADGKPDVVAATWVSAGQIRCRSGADGSLLWAHPLGTGNNGMRVAPIGDVDQDGLTDVAVASWDNATYALSGGTGAQIWRTPAGTLNGGDVWAVDRVDDVTGDGIPDVIGGSFDRNAYLYNGVTGAVVWSVDVGARVFSVRGVGDLSGNGISDVLVGTQMLNGVGGKLFALEGNDVAAVALPEAMARSIASGIELAWETATFVPGTTFNVYRRELDPVDPAGGERRLLLAAKAAIAGSGKTAREQKAEVEALTASDPFVRLNATPIQPSGQRAIYRDETALAGLRYEYRVGYTAPGSPIERYLAPVEAVRPAPRPALVLGAPAPQPARGPVSIALDLAGNQPATAAVYTVDGRPVRVLATDLAPGARHALQWDGRAAGGERAPAGVYLLRVTAGEAAASRKVVLLP